MNKNAYIFSSLNKRLILFRSFKRFLTINKLNSFGKYFHVLHLLDFRYNFIALFSEGQYGKKLFNLTQWLLTKLSNDSTKN